MIWHDVLKINRPSLIECIQLHCIIDKWLKFIASEIIWRLCPSKLWRKCVNCLINVQSSASHTWSTTKDYKCSPISKRRILETVPYKMCYDDLGGLVQLLTDVKNSKYVSRGGDTWKLLLSICERTFMCRWYESCTRWDFFDQVLSTVLKQFLKMACSYMSK